jgi:hypothetical protein
MRYGARDRPGALRAWDRRGATSPTAATCAGRPRGSPLHPHADIGPPETRASRPQPSPSAERQTHATALGKGAVGSLRSPSNCACRNSLSKHGSRPPSQYAEDRGPRRGACAAPAGSRARRFRGRVSAAHRTRVRITSNKLRQVHTRGPWVTPSIHLFSNPRPVRPLVPGLRTFTARPMSFQSARARRSKGPPKKESFSLVLAGRCCNCTLFCWMVRDEK